MLSSSFIFFVVGLAVGSFLNVVVCRLREGETLLGRSFCRSCRHQIRWYDNIPLLSFLVLRGKCRDCHAVFSWQYPLLEFVTGLLFFLVGFFFFDSMDERSWLQTAWLLGIVSFFLVIAVYDMIHMEIPTALLVLVFFWMIVYLGLDFRGLDFSWSGREVQALSGAVSVGAFFFALVFVSKETWMGWGDVWLGALSGMIVGLSSALFMITLSFGLGAIVGILLMLFGRKGMKSQLPFAPYLVAGVLLTIFLPEIFPESVKLLLL